MNRFSIALGLMVLLTLPTHALERVMYESDMTNYVTKADATLEPVAFDAWDLSPLPAALQSETPAVVYGAEDYQWQIKAYGAYSVEHFPTEEAARAATSITVYGPDCPTSTEITRAATSYRLGPNANTNPNHDIALAGAASVSNCISRVELQAALANINTNIVTAEDARVALTNLIVTLRNL